jgi:hypothetical protein
MIGIAIGFVLSFIIGAGCRDFDYPRGEPASDSRRSHRSRDDSGL